nr:reverse transcriptase domain-containing protein [Tanacetum cinerariifolium]
MAELHFNNDHNKVAYLLKPTESQGFHQIIDFMNGLYIRYALTANLTINASVVRQFWGSASEVSLLDGVKGLVATIDGTAYTVTEASIRSALQLDDLNAIDTLTNEEIFASLRDIGNIAIALGHDMPLLAHMLNQWEPTFVQAQQQDGSPSLPSPVVALHPLPDPMPSPPRQSSPPPIPFGLAPSSGVASTKTIPDIPSLSRPSEPVLETITFPIRDDDTGGGSFHESPPSPPPATLTRSPIVGVAEEPLTLTSLLALFPTFLQRIATLEAEVKATKILHRDIVVLFAKRIKKFESKLKTKKRKLVLSDLENEEEARQSQELDALLHLANAALHDPTVLFWFRLYGRCHSCCWPDSAGGLDSAGGVVSAGGADSASGLTSTGISIAAGPTAAILEAERQELLEQELKQRLDVEQVYLDSLLAQRVAEEQERESRESAAQMVDLMNKRRKAIAEMKAKAKRENPMTPAQQKEFMRTFVKNQSSTIYTTCWTWKDVRGLTDDQLQIVYDKIRRAVDLATAKDHHKHLKRKLQSVSAGATITAGDPIPTVTSVSAASSVPAGITIAAGVFITAGATGSASEATVHIIELLDSLHTIGSEDRRTGPEFKKYLRQVSDDDGPAEPVSLALVSDIRTWEIIQNFLTEFGLGQADLMVLYGMVSDKYKIERATDPNVAVDTSCCSTLNPHTALMTIYYWKLDNKQVTIQFRGGLLGIVIPAARVFCSYWKVFISAGVLFLLATGRALIDVHKGELTLCIRNEAITYNLDQTSRYSANYDQMTANKIDVTDEACEEYSQEVLGFSDVTASGSLMPSDDPIVSTTSPTLTPFGDSDFLLFEEADAFLCLEDEPDSPKFDPSYYDPERDILLLEAILNSEPSPSLPNHEPSVPLFKNELKACEAKMIKSSVDEPPEGINPEFCTHKILMEEDYKPTVQHQRRVNPKIHDVIKKEVEKLLDAGLIYPISDSPWVSPVHCVPKKGGFTVVKNEENELIPTRLVTKWRVCIDYRKLNEATRDHFPLPFIDQMLERLAGNEYYCFLDGFSGYFQIPIDPRDPEKTTFTYPYGTFAYRRMPFGLCNAPGMFQRCMLAIFHDMVEKTMKVFMDDFSDAKARLLRWVLLLQEFDFDVLDTKGAENLAADHLSRLENPYENVLNPKEINETFPLETLSTGNDFMGPFSSSQENKYILMAVDYLSKWVETKALPTNDARVVCKFLKSLFARFGAPRAIISDRGTHFCNDQFAKVMRKYGVTHRLSTTYHPQTSGQVEVSNRGLKRILERTIGQNRASWSDKLDDALWAFRTAYKTPIRCTPYKLVYEKACHLPMELEHQAYWALKQANFDLVVAGDHRKIQLNELNELRDQAYENSLIYKEKTKRIHDSKIKNRVFNVGDRVLLFNSRLKIFSGKLKTRWSGPFTITQVFPYGTVELSQANGPNFNVNGHRIKHYFGGDVPQSVVPDLQTFPP